MPDDDGPIGSTFQFATRDQLIRKVMIDLETRPVIPSVALPVAWYERLGDLTPAQTRMLLALHRLDPSERWMFFRVPKSLTQVIVGGIHQVDLRKIVGADRSTIPAAWKRLEELNLARLLSRRGAEYYQLYPYKELKDSPDATGTATYWLYSAPDAEREEIAVIHHVSVGDDDASDRANFSDARVKKFPQSSEKFARSSDFFPRARLSDPNPLLKPKSESESAACAPFSNSNSGAKKFPEPSDSDFGKAETERRNAFNSVLVATANLWGRVSQPGVNQKESDRRTAINRFDDLLWPRDEITVAEGRLRTKEAVKLAAQATLKRNPMAWWQDCVKKFAARRTNARPAREVGTDPIILVRGVLRQIKRRGLDPRCDEVVRYVGSSIGWQREEWLEQLADFESMQSFQRQPEVESWRY